MFDQIFSLPRVLDRHRSGPLVEERRAFVDHLAKQGLSNCSLRATAQYLLVVVDYLQLADRPDEIIGKEEIELSSERWANRKPRPKQMKDGHISRQVFRLVASRWLHFLGRLEVSSDNTSPYEAMITSFSDYMLRERGLAPGTIRGRCWFLRRFLGRLGNGNTLHEITITDIDDLFQDMLKARSYARVTIQLWATDLRAFFRYADIQGWCQKGLSIAIQGPRVYSQSTVPFGPSWKIVRRLISTTEGSKPSDIRDRAILLLLAIYGWRAGEVRGLRLDDFDWSNELVSVSCSKVRGNRTFPLVRVVGDSVLRYLKEVRPTSAHREVFLTLYAHGGPSEVRHASAQPSNPMRPSRRAPNRWSTISAEDS